MFDLLIMRDDAGELVEAAIELNKANDCSRRLQARREELVSELEKLDGEWRRRKEPNRRHRNGSSGWGDDDGAR